MTKEMSHMLNSLQVNNFIVLFSVILLKIWFPKRGNLSYNFVTLLRDEFNETFLSSPLAKAQKIVAALPQLTLLQKVELDCTSCSTFCGENIVRYLHFRMCVTLLVDFSLCQQNCKSSCPKTCQMLQCI